MQRYKCLQCQAHFSSRRRPEKLHKTLFEKYLFHSRTLHDLAREYHCSIPTVRLALEVYEPAELTVEVRPVVLIADATYFGHRGSGFASLVFLDVHTPQVIAYMHLYEHEATRHYRYLKEQVEALGFTIQAVVIDGRKGLIGVFEGLPVQWCHFHQQQTLTRYLTQNPKTEAGKDLKRIASYLGKVSQRRFQRLLEAWCMKHQNFIDEKVEDNSKRGWHYKHKRIRSAYRSLWRNLPYLYTYERYPDLHIPNTTNALDGGLFSPLKKRINFHAGSSMKLQIKMVDEYLLKYNKNE